MKNIPTLIIFVTIVIAILFGMQYYVIWRVSKLFPIEINIYYISSIILITFSMIGMIILSRYFYNYAIIWLNNILFYYLGFIWIAFVILLLINLVQIFNVFPNNYLQYSLIIILALTCIYSSINGKNIKIEEVKIKTNKVNKNYKIVHLSDLHLGIIDRKDFIENVVLKIKKLNPNFVVITGDLFSEATNMDEDVLSPFDKLSVPVYFITGNHEYITDYDQVKKLLKATKIQMLSNEKVLFDQNIQIIGIDDIGFKKRDSLKEFFDKLNLNKNNFTLFLSHQPISFNIIQDLPIDMELAGHTHGGQIFPFNLLVKIFFSEVNGLYNRGEQNIYVSPGTNTWGPPLRLGSFNEITVIEVVNE